MVATDWTSDTLRVRIGTCSWTDAGLLKSGWYPAVAHSAEQRLAYYADQFPIVEVDSSYYALPSEQNSHLWLARTPPGFVFNIKAFSLLTGHNAPQARLPVTVRDTLPDDVVASKRSVYLKDLPETAQQWVWGAFAAALQPLQLAGKLGAVLFQYPPWFSASRDSRRYIERCRDLLPSMHLAIEFRNSSWMTAHDAPETLALLRDLGLSYVCVDEPQGFRSSVPPVVAVTQPQLAVVRFHGRNAEHWEARGASVAERFRYLYSDDELQTWTPSIRRLAGEAEQTHVLFNNCYTDYGVRNARQLSLMLDLVPPGGRQ